MVPHKTPGFPRGRLNIKAGIGGGVRGVVLFTIVQVAGFLESFSPGFS